MHVAQIGCAGTPAAERSGHRITGPQVLVRPCLRQPSCFMLPVTTARNILESDPTQFWACTWGGAAAQVLRKVSLKRPKCQVAPLPVIGEISTPHNLSLRHLILKTDMYMSINNLARVGSTCNKLLSTPRHTIWKAKEEHVWSGTDPQCAPR